MFKYHKGTFNKFLRTFIVAGVGFIMLYPLMWLLAASFRNSNAEIFTSVGIIPDKLDFSAYRDGWKMGAGQEFSVFFLNTFKIVFFKVIFSVISCTLTAYGFARFNFWGKKFLFSLLIATLLLPEVVIRIPQFLIFKQLGWLDTYLPLIVPSFFAIQTFFVFMLIQFIRTIPKDLEEAAYIDGCGVFKTLLYIMVPVLSPAIISVALFEFLWSMNDFMGPLIYISSVEKYPISLALRMSIDATSEIHWNRIIAISIVSLIPSLIIFFSAQRYFVDGITAGSVKG